MRTVACNECGMEVGVDDFIVQQCPCCDSFMPLTRLNLKVDPELGAVVRINPAQNSALVERE